VIGEYFWDQNKQLNACIVFENLLFVFTYFTRDLSILLPEWKGLEAGLLWTGVSQHAQSCKWCTQATGHIVRISKNFISGLDFVNYDGFDALTFVRVWNRYNAGSVK
jgi:hypothetical protein